MSKMHMRVRHHRGRQAEVTSGNGGWVWQLLALIIFTITSLLLALSWGSVWIGGITLVVWFFALEAVIRQARKPREGD